MKNFFDKLSEKFKFKDNYKKIIDLTSKDKYCDVIFRIKVDKNTNNIEEYFKKVNEIIDFIEYTMEKMKKKKIEIDIINEYYNILVKYLKEHKKSKLSKKLIDYLKNGFNYC